MHRLKYLLKFCVITANGFVLLKSDEKVAPYIDLSRHSHGGQRTRGYLFQRPFPEKSSGRKTSGDSPHQPGILSLFGGKPVRSSAEQHLHNQSILRIQGYGGNRIFAIAVRKEFHYHTYASHLQTGQQYPADSPHLPASRIPGDQFPSEEAQYVLHVLE